MHIICSQTNCLTKRRRSYIYHKPSTWRASTPPFHTDVQSFLREALDFAVLPDNDLVDLEGRLDWVRLTVDPLELLESSALRLDAKAVSIRERARGRHSPEEIPDDRLDNVPSNEHIDVLVSEVVLVESNWPSELIDETHGVDNDTRSSETLGAHGRFEGLGRDDTLKRRVGEGEDDVEQEVSGKRSLSDARPSCLAHLLVLVDLG